MTEPFVPRRPIFKKKKKHKGADWEVDREPIDQHRARKGILCRECHKVIPWKKLTISYDLVKGRPAYRNWFCDRCGNCVRTEKISTKGAKRGK